MGRNPIANLIKTAGEFARPSFIDVWFGKEKLEYRSDEGTLLRTENRQTVEREYLSGLGQATWTTIRIATLGSLLGALLGLPLALLTARNLNAPRPFIGWQRDTRCCTFNPYAGLWFGVGRHCWPWANGRNFGDWAAFHGHLRQALC